MAPVVFHRVGLTCGGEFVPVRSLAVGDDAGPRAWSIAIPLDLLPTDPYGAIVDELIGRHQVVEIRLSPDASSVTIAFERGGAHLLKAPPTEVDASIAAVAVWEVVDRIRAATR